MLDDTTQGIPEGAPQEDELAEIVRRVNEEGLCVLWSTTLKDHIAFYKTPNDLARMPPGYVSYSDEELRTLFGDSETAPSPSALRLIHEAKKIAGGKVVENSPEGPQASVQGALL